MDNNSSFLFVLGVAFILLTPGCVEQSMEESDATPAMEVNEMYYFQFLFSMQLEIKQGTNISIESSQLLRCDEKPIIGCNDNEYDGEQLNFDIPANASEVDNIWIDESSYSSPVFVLFGNDERKMGHIFTEKGIAFALSTQSNFNETKGAEWNISDGNGDGELQMCFIGLSDDLSYHHTLFVDQIKNNSSENEVNELYLQRYNAYLEMFQEAGVLEVYNDYCEADYSIGSFSLNY